MKNVNKALMISFKSRYNGGLICKRHHAVAAAAAAVREDARSPRSGTKQQLSIEQALLLLLLIQFAAVNFRKEGIT